MVVVALRQVYEVVGIVPTYRYIRLYALMHTLKLFICLFTSYSVSV